jgi:hypothetical protein
MDWHPLSEFAKMLREELQAGQHIARALNDIGSYIARQVKTRSNWATGYYKTGRPYDLLDSGQFMTAIRPSRVKAENGMWQIGVASIQELDSLRRPGFNLPDGTSIPAGDRAYWRFLEWGLPPNPYYRFIPVGLSPFERKRRKMKVSTNTRMQIAYTKTKIESHTKKNPTRKGKSYIIDKQGKNGARTSWRVGQIDGYKAQGPKVYEKGIKLLQSRFKIRGFMVKNTKGGAGHSGIAPTFLFRHGLQVSLPYIQQQIGSAVQRTIQAAEKKVT